MGKKQQAKPRTKTSGKGTDNTKPAQRTDREIILNVPQIVKLSKTGQEIEVRELPLGKVDALVEKVLAMVQRGVLSVGGIDIESLDSLTTEQIVDVLVKGFGGSLSEFVLLAATDTGLTDEQVKNELTLMDGVNLLKTFVYVNELPRVITGFFDVARTLAANRGTDSQGR